MKFKISSYNKLKYLIPISLISISLLSACSDSADNDTVNSSSDVVAESNVDSSNSQYSEKGSNDATSNKSVDSSEANTATEEPGLDDFSDYTFEDFVEKFSADNFSLKNALRIHILDLALDTCYKNSYKISLVSTNIEDGSSSENIYLYDNRNFKVISPDVFDNETKYASLYLHGENALYYYDVNSPSPNIEKYPNFSQDPDDFKSQPGAIGNLAPYDFTLTDPTSIEFGEVDGKKVLSLTVESDSNVITNHIDLETGFSLLRTESYKLDGTLKKVYESKAVVLELNPDFKSDEFTLPKAGKIIEIETGG